MVAARRNSRKPIASPNMLSVWQNPRLNKKSSRTLQPAGLTFPTSPTKWVLKTWMSKVRNLSTLTLESCARKIGLLASCLKRAVWLPLKCRIRLETWKAQPHTPILWNAWKIHHVEIHSWCCVCFWKFTPTWCRPRVFTRLQRGKRLSLYCTAPECLELILNKGQFASISQEVSLKFHRCCGSIYVEDMMVNTRNTVSGGATLANAVAEHSLRLPWPVVSRVWQVRECGPQDPDIAANYVSPRNRSDLVHWMWAPPGRRMQRWSKL